MRLWGAAFLVSVVAGVVLPSPLGWILLAMLIVAGALSAVVEYADNRIAREVLQAEDTAKSRVYLAQLRATDDDVEAEWAALAAATTPSHVPAQRVPGSAS